MLLTLKKKNKKGFTLIELIVVVAILAILAAIAVPSFIGLQARATKGVEIAGASALCGAINVKNAMDEGTVADKVGIAAADVTALGDLAPTFDPGVNLANVYALVTVSNGVAFVNDTTLD